MSVAVDVALRADAVIGEGPVWDDRTATLYWLDTRAGLVHRFTPADGADTVMEIGQPLGALALGANGGVLLSIEQGFGVLPAGLGGEMRVLEVETELGGRRMNDGACDPAGRYWSGTLAWDWTEGAGSMYRLDPDLRITRAFGGLTISNGLDWSPDGRTLYYVDSHTYRVDAIPFDVESGATGERAPFVVCDRAGGRPDGLTVDAEGGVWVAFSGGSCVRRHLPDGTLDMEIALPVTKVTNMAFAGAGLADLYITTGTFHQPGDPPTTQPLAGSLFVCRPGPTGRPANRFAGV